METKLPSYRKVHNVVQNSMILFDSIMIVNWTLEYLIDIAYKRGVSSIADKNINIYTSSTTTKIIKDLLQFKEFNKDITETHNLMQNNSEEPVYY